MDKALFQQRRLALTAQLPEQSILVLFAGRAPHKSADGQYRFTPNRNFYYLTGLHEDNMILFISRQGGSVRETLFLEPADPVQEKWVGRRLSKDDAQARSGIQFAEYLDQFKPRLERLLVDGNTDHLYLDLEQRGWDDSPSTAQQFAADMAQRYPALVVHNAYAAICALRVIKSPEEVDALRQAIAVTDRGLRNMWAKARPGMMEYELEAHFDFVLKSAGVAEHAFDSIIAAGRNATILHYVENNNAAQDGDLVLTDLGAQYGYYNADITRTFPVNGRFTARQRAVYDIVLEAGEATIRAMKPGTLYKVLNETASRVLADGLKRLGLIESDSQLSQYYYHGVSHFLGLDTHDVGQHAPDMPLAAGMVLTVEPGLYIAEENIGIRIEDNVLITDTGCEVLSSAIPKKAEDIESLMAGTHA